MALDAAHAAKDAWGRTSVQERSNILLKIADRIDENLEAIAVAETWDNGKPVRETLAADIPLSSDHFRYYAGCIRSQEGSLSQIDNDTVAYHFHEPIGVVGQIIPWNFPLLMAAWKLAPALAAGNCIILKPAEQTPASILVLMEIISDLLPPGVLNVVNGFGKEAGEALATSTRIGKIAFTGSTAVGSHILKCAAENLIPSTVELGGKSPVIVGKSSKIQETAQRVMQGKTMNAGQICLAPDYALVPEEKLDEFVKASVEVTSEMYPDIKDNDDFTSIVNQKHFDRIQGLLEDAKEKGADIVEINPSNEDFSQQPHHKIPPTILLNPSEDMKIMQEEIFGPVLPVKTYKDVSESVNYINSKDRPLGLYYFGEDTNEKEYVLDNTTSGGVTVNDVISHIQMEDLPFGGVGPSGMGSYHGYDGFKEFSHAKAVYKQTKINLMKLGGLVPPYKKKEEKPSA